MNLRAVLRIALVAVLAVAASACATPVGRGWMEPMDAIRGANERPREGIRGHFLMTVRAVGSQDSETYLNSERDYRDQRNLTLVVPEDVLSSLEQHLGVSIDELPGRRIVVHGTARRTTIVFLNEERRPSGKYYFQTQLMIDGADQVRFVN